MYTMFLWGGGRAEGASFNLNQLAHCLGQRGLRAVLAQQGYGVLEWGDWSEWQKERGTGTPEFDTAVKTSMLWNCDVSVGMDRIKYKWLNSD